MARTKHQLLQERKERHAREESQAHHNYLKSTNSFRKYGGVPDSQGKVYDLTGKGKALARKINAPNAKVKRALRRDEHQGHANSFTTRVLAQLNHKK